MQDVGNTINLRQAFNANDSPAGIQETLGILTQEDRMNVNTQARLENQTLETQSWKQTASIRKQAKERDDSTKDEGRQRQQTLTCKLGTEVQKGKS